MVKVLKRLRNFCFLWLGYFCKVRKPAVLKETFYTRSDLLQIARELLGMVIVTDLDGVVTAGRIVETEAYAGVADRASHAFGGRRTLRTEVMYAHGGVAYVYLCYGIHHLFNVVTNQRDIPHAVLIRGVEPVEGIPAMLARRKQAVLKSQLTAGPGALSKALGISTLHTGLSLTGPRIRIEDRGLAPGSGQIVATTRIGVDYAGTDALLPYRFYIQANPYVSRF